MSKKVLILSGSPRKGGNSDLLCDEFMKGALESGNQVEKIFLRSKKVAPCNANVIKLSPYARMKKYPPFFERGGYFFTYIYTNCNVYIDRFICKKKEMFAELKIVFQ